MSGHANDLCVRRSHTQSETLSPAALRSDSASSLGRLASFRRGRKRCCCPPSRSGSDTPPPPSQHLFPLSPRRCHAAGRAEADRWRVCEPTVHSEVNLQLKFRYTGSVLEHGGRTVLPHCLEWEQRDTRSNKILNREV